MRGELSTKAKAGPGVKDRGGVSVKRLQHTWQPHTFLTHTRRAFRHQFHLLSTSVMLLMAHDSVLPTGPQEVEMGYCQEGGRASGLGEEWKRMTGPFPEKGRNSNTGPGLRFFLGSTSLHLSPKPVPSKGAWDFIHGHFFSLSPDSLFHLHPFLIMNPLLAVNPHFLSTSQNPISNTQLTCHPLQEAFPDLFIILPACRIVRSTLLSSLPSIPTSRPLRMSVSTWAHTHVQAV